VTKASRSRGAGDVPAPTTRQVPPAPPGARSLRRDAALVALSRDHHDALVQALALRRARAATDPAVPVRVAREFLAFVETDLRGHFADEEAVVLPVADAAAPVEAARARAEHREIEASVSELAAALGTGREPGPLCGELGDLLHDHVRFEERGLFEALQRALAQEALADLGRALEAHRLARGRAPDCARR